MASEAIVSISHGIVTVLLRASISICAAQRSVLMVCTCCMRESDENKHAKRETRLGGACNGCMENSVVEMCPRKIPI
ncbi:hypothetical protein LI328DRAFT_130020, partial [Trichoderma asperelloides]